MTAASQTFQLEVTFQTARPLSQQTGQRLWRYASHFHATGPSTYKLETVVQRDLQATLPEALASLMEAISEAVDVEQPMWPMRVVAVSATELELVGIGESK